MVDIHPSAGRKVAERTATFTLLLLLWKLKSFATGLAHSSNWERILRNRGYRSRMAVGGQQEQHRKRAMKLTLAYGW